MKLDKYVFQWIKRELEGATPDKIAEFYVKNFVFKNEGYLETIQKEYNLSTDILKMHSKIIKLAP